MAGNLWMWDLVEQRADQSPAAVCATDETGRTLSFGQLRDQAQQTARGLVECGVGPGAAVCWQLPTWIESLVLVAALSRLGAIQVPLLPIYREKELRVALTQSRPRLVICPTTWRGVDYRSLYEQLVTEVLPADSCQILSCDRVLPRATGDEVLLPDKAVCRGGPSEHRWVFFTSGTTGEPKGARHTDRSVGIGPATFVERVQLTPGDRYPIVFPFTHIGGIGILFAQLISGASAVLEEQFNQADTIDRLGAAGITIGAGGTPLVQLYLDRQRVNPGHRLFSQLRLCLTGAAPKPPLMHEMVRSELGGMGCISTYGLTEAPFSTISAVSDIEADLAVTEGRPIPDCEIRIVSSGGRICGADQVGEVCLRGPQLCLGYLDTSLDASAFDAAGFLRTGDLGSVDARGNLTIRGRLKDIIIRRGENISGPEVENILRDHPAIADVAVIGVPDERLGERCCAVVVLEPDRSITLEDVSQFCISQGLARQKAPEQLEFASILPRNAAGKVRKQELRTAFSTAIGDLS